MTESSRGLRIVFVCTANIARSPYAERRASGLLTGSPDVEVSSAGIPGRPGRPMDEQMAAILRERGGSPDGHVSRSLNWWILATADLVLTFEFAQHMRILDAWPDQDVKVMGLLQFLDAAERLDTLAPQTPEPVNHPRAVPELVATAAAIAQPNSMTWDIADPYRRGDKAARECAAQIDDALARVLPLLSVTAVGGTAPQQAPNPRLTPR